MSGSYPAVAIRTVGHSSHPAAEFLALLQRHGIAGAADVRRYPAARRDPHFNRPALAKSLGPAGIACRHFPQPGAHCTWPADSPHTGLSEPALRRAADHPRWRRRAAPARHHVTGSTAATPSASSRGASVPIT